MLSPIQLRQHVFTAIDIETIENADSPTEESYAIDLKFGAPEKREDLWHGKLEVSFSPETGNKARYRGRVAVQGTFAVHPDFDKTKEEALVKFNSGSLLLAAIREMVLILTSRSAKGPMELPTFNPNLFVQQTVAPQDQKPASQN
jgi:preprotein translocase subunit SecB